ncbi:MAG TPA: permease [Streptosporangiaceae bacterium]
MTVTGVSPPAAVWSASLFACAMLTSGFGPEFSDAAAHRAAWVTGSRRATARHPGTIPSGGIVPGVVVAEVLGGTAGMQAIGHALALSATMTWQIAWALILGFALSAVVQALVPKSVIVRLLGNDRPRTLAVAAGLGAASSSCSYAAVALARSLFRKGANFTAAMAFEIASTNLVIELGVLLALLVGWQFTAAEFIGGPIMIIIVAVLFRLILRDKLLRDAREHADRGLAGSMEGHAAMDMSVSSGAPLRRRLMSGPGFTAVSHIFVMEWAAIIRDLVIGLLIAGAVGAWVPDTFWRGFFLSGHPVASAVWGPIVGPVVAILTFVCSIGNVPLAAVLWKAGISFGGVTAFIFADLLILPILNIYRKYYGIRMTLAILAAFYAAMVVAGYATEAIFGGLGLVPSRASVKITQTGVSWDYTTWLDLVFLLVAVILLVRFTRTGGLPMLRMMGGSPDDDHAGHDHTGHSHGHDFSGHSHGHDETGNVHEQDHSGHGHDMQAEASGAAQGRNASRPAGSHGRGVR